MNYKITTSLHKHDLRPVTNFQPDSERIAQLALNLMFECGADAVKQDGDTLTVRIPSGHELGEASAVARGLLAMNALAQILKVCEWADFTSEA